MKKIFTAIICLFVLQTYAQTVTVTGKVTDEYNVPLMGAGIQIKGTQQGVATDFEEVIINNNGYGGTTIIEQNRGSTY